MAKQSITFAQWVTNSISNLPNQVKGQATSLKTLFDKAALDIKTYVDTTLITELNGNNGANKIGLLNANIGADNVADGLEEVRQIAVQAQAGTIVDNSISDIKLASDVKIGSLATLDTTDKTNVTNAINETFQLATTANGTANTATSTVSALSTTVDILREPKVSAGSAIAMTIDTAGTFSRATNNRLMFIPHTTNTGSLTISEDGQTAKTCKKAEGTSYVDLISGDVKQGAPTEFVWSVANDFFILRPSGGSNIKSIQSGTATLSSTTLDVTITAIDTTKSIVYITYKSTNGNLATALTACSITSSTNVRFERNSTSSDVTVYWTVVEFNNVKSLQTGTTVFATASATATITAVNLSKSIIFISNKSSITSTVLSDVNLGGVLTNTTTITFNQSGTVSRTAFYQVIEFN